MQKIRIEAIASILDGIFAPPAFFNVINLKLSVLEHFKNTAVFQCHATNWIKSRDPDLKIYESESIAL